LRRTHVAKVINRMSMSHVSDSKFQRMLVAGSRDLLSAIRREHPVP